MQNQRNLQSAEENCFSPILPQQRKMKTAKEERAEKIKVSNLFLVTQNFDIIYICVGLCSMSSNEQKGDR